MATLRSNLINFLVDTFASTTINGQLSFGQPVFAPGIHVMSGLTGGDTYNFEGFWGGALVLELPSPTVGFDFVNFGSDTLDFQPVTSTLIFDIYSVTAGNIDEFSDKFSFPLSIGANVVICATMLFQRR